MRTRTTHKLTCTHIHTQRGNHKGGYGAPRNSHTAAAMAHAAAMTRAAAASAYALMQQQQQQQGGAGAEGGNVGGAAGMGMGMGGGAMGGGASIPFEDAGGPKPPDPTLRCVLFSMYVCII
jgi:hypothetical protein